MATISSKRIAKNTAFLYVRMLVLLVISLYTARVVLEKLGIVDFGIYNVVGGLAGMCGFFSTSLSNATERFLNIALGKKDYIKANKIFNQNLIIFSLIALGLILLSETIIKWFVFDNLNIPADKWDIAEQVYQFTIFSLAINFVGITYVSSIIANEDMKVFSYIGIYEGVGKLGIAFLIGAFPLENLVTYALLLMLLTLSVQILYIVYCHRHYIECRFKLIWEKSLISETFRFIGWNVFSAVIYLTKDGVVNILMNIYYGPVVNAARAVSMQVTGAISNFTTNIFVATRPQMVKSYAAKEYNELIQLFFYSSKFTVLLFWIICLPVMLTINQLLHLWLVDVPDYSAIFTVWVLADSMLAILTNPTWSISLASGRMKKYILYGNGMLLLVLPLCWICFYLDYPPVSAFVIIFICRVLQVMKVVQITSSEIRFRAWDYMRRVINPILIVVAVSTGIMYPVKMWIAERAIHVLIYIVIISLISVIINTTLIWRIALSRAERSKITGTASRILKNHIIP